jgi:hypothetical protein
VFEQIEVFVCEGGFGETRLEEEYVPRQKRVVKIAHAAVGKQT